ncbi:MAG TPA: tetratricopeptide repeat protein [Bryobacteraceae bacterium]|jgi:tetratricopeptide (TPR) repeat protein|nr:tetratricopeptide repeat protein [Bryobacteraceae bacterium]
MRDSEEAQAPPEDLADALAGEERYAEATSLLETETTRQRETFGPMHPLPPWLASDLADDLRYQQKYGDAEAVLRRQIEVVQNEERRGMLPRLLYELASVQTEMGKKDDALRSLKQALDLGYISMAGEGLARDHNFASLKGDSRFQALVEENRRNLEAARKKPIIE